MSITAKLREMTAGIGEKIVGARVSRAIGSLMLSSLAVGCESPFVRSLGSGAAVDGGGGICSQRAWVGCVIFGINIRFV